MHIIRSFMFLNLYAKNKFKHCCFFPKMGVMRKIFVFVFSFVAMSLNANTILRAGITPVFPNALFKKNISDYVYTVSGYTVKNLSDIEAEERASMESLQSVLLNNDLVGIYGKPNAYTMGVLGRYDVTELDPIVDYYVQLYDAANGERGVIPVLYLIYATCFPGGDLGLLSDSTVKKYIDYAAERGWYVFLDHQIGRFSVENAINTLLPYLKYRNVHLAIDPEWHTDKPMQEIGSVSAAEINKAQQMIQDYLIKHNIPERKFFVIHQFNAVMIQQRSAVRSNFDRVQLIHCSDGHGSPYLKRQTYAYNAAAYNMPLKSFKLFTKPTVAGAGYDIPIMTPEEVLNLQPRPYFIMYQ